MPRSQTDHSIQLSLRERGLLARALDLDEPPRAGHYHVKIHFSGDVLGIVEVQEQPSSDAPDAHSRYHVGDRRGSDELVPLCEADGVAQGDVRP